MLSTLLELALILSYLCIWQLLTFEQKVINEPDIVLHINKPLHCMLQYYGENTKHKVNKLFVLYFFNDL